MVAQEKQRQDQWLPGIQTAVLLVNEEKTLCEKQSTSERCPEMRRWIENFFGFERFLIVVFRFSQKFGAVFQFLIIGPNAPLL